MKIQNQLESFLRQHPKLSDKAVHHWAMKHQIDIDKVEEMIYRIATIHVKEKRKLR